MDKTVSIYVLCSGLGPDAVDCIHGAEQLGKLTNPTTLYRWLREKATSPDQPARRQTVAQRLADKLAEIALNQVALGA